MVIGELLLRVLTISLELVTLLSKEEVMAKTTIDSQKVIDLYLNNKMSTVEVANTIGCSPGGVRASLLRSGITPRSCGEAASKRTIESLGFIPTKEWLTEVMQVFDGNAMAAAKHYGVNYTTFLDHLKKHNINRLPAIHRRGSGAHKKKLFDVDAAVQMSKNGLSYESICNSLGIHIGALVRELKNVGYSAPRGRKMENKSFRTVANPKRAILNELGITSCEICGETRALDFAHIKPSKDGGLTHKDNCLVLCALHHRCFDNGTLTQQEFLLVKSKVRQAESSFGFKYRFFQEW